MEILKDTKPKEVFKYFEEICSIPHGSGDMDRISAYCEEFAKKHLLRYVRDNANNVIIYKDATSGYEKSEPVILQGHIDMVCQKEKTSPVDFEKDGLDIFKDGDFIKAKGTTLGADNGIAVSMIMAILASDDIAHPPIEAVFTTDEEIGMIGAGKLDTALLKGKRMINLDAEEEEYLTVSCAGGSDFKAILPLSKKTVSGKKATIEISGLSGGHSGVEIDKGRVNANILSGRLLNSLSKKVDFDIASINGGTKANAITVSCEIELVAYDEKAFFEAFTQTTEIIKNELKDRESRLSIILEMGDFASFDVILAEEKKKLIHFLLATPNGVMDMSVNIKGLVETSLNLGILKTEENEITAVYALRSNKASSLDYLEEKMTDFSKFTGFNTEISARYEPWEYKDNSELQRLYKKVFLEKTGKEPIVTAIHAGLECAVFSSAIPELDCIAIGPDMFGVHTVGEKLSISSTARIYEILCALLAQM